MRLPKCLKITRVVNQESTYLDIIDTSLASGLKKTSNLADWVLELEGMSGHCYRHFINQLAHRIPNCRYLEVGAWKGSTSVSCGFLNKDISMTIIDSWEEVDKCRRRRKAIQFKSNGDPKIAFEDNIAKMQKEGGCQNITIYNKDFRKVKLRQSNFNLYFYDGPHFKKDQYDGLDLFTSYLDNEFIFIVDDWNWEPVRSGTNQAIKDNNLIVKSQIEIFDKCKHFRAESRFHNGYSIFVLQKQ